MDRKSFLEMYKDEIIAEPSGRTYAELEKDRLGRYLLIESLTRG
jgi:hypothetical protein